MHNPTVFSGFIKGEAIRHHRNNSNTQNLKDTICKFKGHLKQRGYKEHEIHRNCESALNIERSELLRFKQESDKQTTSIYRTSMHNPTVFSGFIKGEAIRHHRNNSNTQNLNNTICKFKGHLKQRGYKEHEIHRNCESALNIERSELLRFKQESDKQTTNRTSMHNPTVFSGFIKGEAIRHHRNNSNTQNLKDTICKFKGHLKQRGYKEHEIHRNCESALNIERSELLRFKQESDKQTTSIYRTSMHNPTVFSGFIKGEAIRHHRNNSNTQNLNNTICKFKGHLKQRGYKEHEIHRNCESALNIERPELLRFKQDSDKQIPLVFVTKYHFSLGNINKALRKHYKKLFRNAKCRELFPKPPMVAYSRHRNLKQILISSVVKA
ncbi:unnamed protein product [Mytilus coruscus]|uniref:Uncharacterized protein n=1 Tax=Mytilus coruscus TaxID=42192 RepID=A0A6J8C871_MYTCO|nr:unnamed protein product [Mytilus coruscus]